MLYVLVLEIAREIEREREGGRGKGVTDVKGQKLRSEEEGRRKMSHGQKLSG